MISSILSFSIRNKIVILLLVAMVIGWGLYSLVNIPMDAVPDITNNQVQVVTVSPSLSPQEVEQFITQPLEFSTSNIPGLVEMRSISRYGLSIITLVFEERVPTLQARQLVSEQINIAKGSIPSGLGEPELMPITTGLGELYQYTLEVSPAFQNRYSSMDLREIQDWVVKRRLSGIPGIIEVSSFGGHLRQYEVGVNPLKLRNFGLSISDVFDALVKNNQNTGSSYIEKGANAYYIRADGLIKNLEEIRQIVIDVRNDIPIRIAEVADVGYGSAPRFGAMTKDGKGEATGGIALMLKGANSMETVKRVKERVEEINKSLPEGIQVVPYLERSTLVNKAINTVSRNLIEGGLIVIFVLVIFLGNFRAGLIVASVIPLSMLFALGMMNLTGVSANLMSLGAIDFGIIVDGAVIIVEGVLFHLHSKFKGKTLSKAEMEGVVHHASSRIFNSAAFGVIIILIVFLPIMSLVGIEGKMFRPMAQTVSYALLGALILSITYVPMVTAWGLNRKVSEKEDWSDKLIVKIQNAYKPILVKALLFPKVVITAAMIVFSISIIGFLRLGGEFIPTLEEGDLAMQMALPPGSSLSQSIKASTMAEEILLKNFPEVRGVVSKIGTAEVPTDPMAVEEADIMILLKDKSEWQSADNREDLVELMKAKLEVIPGIEFDFTQPIQLRFNELMTGVKTDIAIKIFGEDMELLFDKANEVARLINGIQGAADIKVEQVEGLPQLRINYDRAQLARYGLSIQDANRIVESSFGGMKAGTVFQGERRFDLVVRLGENYRKDLDLNNLTIGLKNGLQLPFSEIATIETEEGPAQISREDAKRRVTIGINVRNRDVESLVTEIKSKLDAQLSLPSGYFISYGGQFQNLQEAKQRLLVAVPIALLLIMVMLYFAFRRLRFALLIFSAVPLSAIGGVAALYIRDMPFSISAGVGFIALFGVAVLNGIVLINYYNQLQKDGITDLQEIIVKGSLVRLRPVLMTAITDIVGFLPMALSGTAGAEVQRPLATVVIGGLLSATLLTLLVLPVLYQWINRKALLSAAGIVLALFVFNPAQSQSLEGRELSLESALEMARQNHPVFINQNLKIEEAKAKKGLAWDLPKAQTGFQYGQINSDARDPFFEVQQEFGSIPAYLKSAKLAQMGIYLVEAQNLHEARSFELEVKQSYLLWLYQYSLIETLREEMGLMESYFEISKLRFDVGEAPYLEKLTADARLTEAKLRLMEAEKELQSASYRLEYFLFEKGPFKPDFTLVDFKFSASKANISSAAHPLFSVLKARMDVQKVQSELERAKLFPGFYVGYFNQRITDFNIREGGLSGFQFGLAIPLWLKPGQSRNHISQIQERMIEQELNMKSKEISSNWLQIQTQIERQEARLEYYQQTGLPQAEELRLIADRQFKGGEASYMEYLQALSTSMEIKRSFLRAKFELQLSQFQLEFYQNEE